MPAPSETVAARPRILIIFDYDLSLVSADCDQFFFEQLDPEQLAEVAASLTAPPPTWTALIDEMLGAFSARFPQITRDNMRETVANIPVSPKTLDAVKHAVDHHDATVMIISDANQFFIHSMLDHHKISQYFTEVHTNRAVWESEADGKSNRLRIQPFHPEESEPHGCELCPANMCKGRILDAIRSKNQYDLVLYVGDGVGDFCPSTRLTSNDTVFARANDPEGKSFGLLEKIDAHRDKVHARVVQWQSGDDIYDHFAQTLKAAAASGQLESL